MISRGKELPSATKDTIIVICLLSSTPRTCMSFDPFFSHVLSPTWYKVNHCLIDVYDKWCKDIATLCAIYVPWSSQFGGSFAIVVIAILKNQPNLAFMNFLDHSTKSLNEPLRSSRTLSSRKLWIMGWTIGLERACLEVLIFCNKDMSSSLTFGLQSNIGMCCFMIVKLFPLSIDFSTPSWNFASKVNHSPNEDLENFSNGLERSPSFLWNARR